MLNKFLKKISSIFSKKVKLSLSQEVDSALKSSRKANKSIQAIIGLDFGTAYTKAAIRVGARDVDFVKFTGIPGVINSCLLPCVMSMDQSGKYSLGMSDNAKKLISQLKLSLMYKNTDHGQKVLIVLFLAFVLSHIRSWFIKNHGQNYLDRTFEWHLNIGVPAESWHDDKLCYNYRQICQLAWHLSLFEYTDITYKNAELIVQKTPNRFINDSDLSQERIGLIPEFVAQIASYTKSPRREAGLHFLVDIGAATLDAVTFNIWDDGIQDKFPIYVSRVRPLGTHFLCKHLIKKDDSHKANDLLYEGYLCFNNNPIEEALSRYSISDKSTEELCNLFKTKVRKIVYDVLRDTRFRRDPRSTHWKHGVPAFICGVGAHIPLYQECIEAFDRNSYKFCLKIRPMSLPTIDSDIKEDTSRLTVAYGLSFDKDDLGRVVPEHEIPDLYENNSLRNIDKSYVSKEQV